MKDEGSGKVVYEFSGFRLDASRFELSRAGRPVELRPRSFSVLLDLLSRPGQVVSRDELIDRVWGGAVVTDDAVTQCLIDIRRALDDKSQSIVRTVPRKGYRFDAEVKRCGSTRGASLRAGPIIAVLLACIATVAAAVWYWRHDTPATAAADTAATVAVLPLRDLSEKGDRSYLADGIAEELIGVLGRVEALRVIARTSSFGIDDRVLDVAAIAGKLGVTHVLSGSVRTSAEAMRVSVQLLAAETGEVEWSGSFDRAMSAEGIFQVQRDIAEAVASALSLPLRFTDDGSRLTLLTDSPVALDEYFQGRYKMETRRAGMLEEARDHFEKATAIDPSFALAWASLADVYRLLSSYGDMASTESLPLARDAIDRALALNPELGEAYASLGKILGRGDDLDRATAAFEKAIALNPNYAPAYQWYGEHLALTGGRADRAQPLLRTAMALDPRSPVIRSDYAEVLAAAGDVDGALRQYDITRTLDPEFAVAWWETGYLLHRGKGNIADAIVQHQRAIELAPEAPNPRTLIVQAYLDLGMLARARASFSDVEQLAPESYYAKLVLLQLQMLEGDASEAVETARASVERRPRSDLALRVLRDHYIDAGRVGEAVALYERVSRKLRPGATVVSADAILAIDYAFALSAAGAVQDARRIAREALALLAERPRLGLADVGIADVRAWLLLGSVDDARQALEEAIAAGWSWRWLVALEHDNAISPSLGEAGFSTALRSLKAAVSRQRERLHVLERERRFVDRSRRQG